MQVKVTEPNDKANAMIDSQRSRERVWTDTENKKMWELIFEIFSSTLWKQCHKR